MKRKLCPKIIVSTVFFASIAPVIAQADSVTVTGGTIHFDGMVVAAACSVSSDSRDQSITLSQIRTERLKSKGERGHQPEGFNIKLEDCDTTVSNNAQVTFNGQADPDETGALQNTAGAGAAANVALRLYDMKGSVLNLGTASPAYPLINGENTLPFTVDYLATGAATAGLVQATATFNVTYS